MEWSKEQELAIFNRDKTNILTSAGAGSGKTAVLTERIYQLIKEGVSLDDFLVLTFTNLAASEMKTRTASKLMKDPELSKLAALVDAAHIETFDSFCLYVVKRFHYYLDLPKEVNIIDETILEIQKQIILRKILDEKYENHDKDFEKLISTFCVKDDDNIFNLVLKIYKQSTLALDKNEFFKNYVNDFYCDEFIDELVNQYYLEVIESLKSCREIAYNLNHVDDANKYLNIIDDLLEATDYDSLRIKMQNTPNFNKSGKDPDDKINRGIIVDTIKAYIDNATKEDFGDRATVKKLYLENKGYAELLLEIANELYKRLFEYKRSQNGYSFDDIANFALQIISNTPAKDILRDTFKHILVDEYQDTSDIQEAVINAISDNNVFMVGDVKQSIYRFRNANCKIFQEKFDNYKIGNGGIEIDLNKSFRSRREIVDGINNMFVQLMSKNFGEIDYSQGHDFIFGQTKYDDFKADNQDYSIELYGYSLEENEHFAEKEAELIADDIIKKCNSKYKVLKGDKLVDVQFKDFALIASRYKNFEKIKKVFGKRNIPLNVVEDKDIGVSDVAIVSKNLIKMLDTCLKENYEDLAFVKTYVSLARSFLFQIKDQEIYDRVKNKEILTTPFMLEFELVKEQLRYLSLHEILSFLYQYFNIDNKMMELGNYKENLMYCEMVLNTANSFDLTGGSIQDFVEYFDNIKNFDLKIKASDKSLVDNAVTLLSIHKSKGLEFPICYFFDLEAKMNLKDSHGAMQASKKFGLLLPITSTSDYTSLPISMFKRDEKAETVLEQIRLYYVALTRAKEKIIILNKKDNPEKPKIVTSLKSASSFKDFNRYLGIAEHAREVIDEKTRLVLSNQDVDVESYELKKVEIESILIERKKASKTIDEDAILEIIEFGNKMHKLLEIVNFDSKDLSFIKDNKERKCIERVVNHEIFNDVKDENIIREYEFYDDINDIRGKIDCIILKDNEVVVIDFKLKNISDEEYINQLHIYKDYVSTITEKPIKTYLLSIIDGIVKEVF